MRLLTILVIIVPIHCWGQNTAVAETFSDISGKPFFPSQYVDVQGTPYLFEEFVPAEMTLTNGRVIKNVRTNINLVTDEVHFLTEDGQAMIANSGVIRSVETKTPDHYRFVPSPSQKALFLLLSDGKAQLFKHQKKTMIETKPFNSGTVQRSFSQNTEVFVAFGGTLHEVNSIDDICRVLSPDGKLKEYATSRKLKKKSLESWTELINHFNATP